MNKIIKYLEKLFASSRQSEPYEQAPISPTKQQSLIGSLTLYYLPTCFYCIRVRNAISRSGLTIAYKNIGFSRAMRAELLAGGGRTMVPCLRKDFEGQSTWLFESTDIIQYLRKIEADIVGGQS